MSKRAMGLPIKVIPKVSNTAAHLLVDLGTAVRFQHFSYMVDYFQLHGSCGGR